MTTLNSAAEEESKVLPPPLPPFPSRHRPLTPAWNNKSPSSLPRLLLTQTGKPRSVA